MALLVAFGAGFLVGPIGASVGPLDRQERSAGPHPVAREERAVGASRVLLVGDSLMFQAGPALREQFQAEGVAVRLHAVPGSGLVSPGSAFDWVEAIGPMVDDFRPDTVIVLLVGNYFPPYMQIGGAEVSPNSPKFFAEWSRRSDELMTGVSEASDRPVTVWWVKPPSMEAPALDARSDAIGLIVERIANDWPAARTVAADTALAGPDGEYTGSITLADGTAVAIRDADGLHLAPSGAERLARHLARTVLDAPA